MKMEKKKQLGLAVVVINCFCAAVWVALAAIDAAFGYDDPVVFGMHILCAVLWTLSASVGLVRYLKEKNTTK